MTFKLRSPNGPNKGKYFVSGGHRGIVWTDDKSKSPSFSADDAYGHVACAVDMCCEALVPECDGATEDDCLSFATMAAGDMWQNGGKSLAATLPRRIGAEERVMEDEHSCPWCDHEFKISLGFHNLGNDVVCPHCDRLCHVEGDYSDGDSWYFHLAKP